MVTYYVLFNPISGEFARAGKNAGVCYSMNAAKHFTSEWSAKNYASAHDDFECFTVKMIQRY